jgi:TfoX/Sxy family transcriptional regulator of competence genes
MAADLEFIRYLTGQMRGAGEITHRLMFGGCTVYCEGKVVALICDEQLFIKPTRSGREFIGEVTEAPPYPGARGFFLIEEQLEDADWLSELVRLTERELPAPKPKKKRKTRARKKSAAE